MVIDLPPGAEKAWFQDDEGIMREGFIMPDGSAYMIDKNSKTIKVNFKRPSQTAKFGQPLNEYEENSDVTSSYPKKKINKKHFLIAFAILIVLGVTIGAILAVFVLPSNNSEYVGMWEMDLNQLATLNGQDVGNPSNIEFIINVYNNNTFQYYIYTNGQKIGEVNGAYSKTNNGSIRLTPISSNPSTFMSSYNPNNDAYIGKVNGVVVIYSSTMPGQIPLQRTNTLPQPDPIIGAWSGSDGTTVFTFDYQNNVVLKKSVLYTCNGNWQNTNSVYSITVYNVPLFGTMQGKGKINGNQLVVNWGNMIGTYTKSII